jgi:PAS domain S-box-containing protein
VSDVPGTSAASNPDAGDIFFYVAEHVHDYAIFLMDRDGKIHTWNKAAEIMKGYTAEDVVGQFFGILYTEDARVAGAPQHHLDMAVKHGAFQEEAWRRRKDGSLFWALIEIIAIRSASNELTAFCKITRDLTNRKALEHQLAAEKERAEVTLAALGEAVVTVDASGAVDYLNPRAEQLTGWTDEEARGHPLPEVFCVTDETTAHPDLGRLHYEVLLRLKDPVRGLLMPGSFMPSAERYNLMPEIDCWVVRRVLQWLDGHREHGKRLDLCAINLSAQTLANEAFPDYLAALFRNASTSPEKLCFEIAGAAAMIDMPKSLAMMRSLRAMGCKLSISGVGTGAASFAYLKQFPADFVKIDASNVTAILQSVVDEKMVTSLNEIAHLLGEKTIAEGIEDQATVDAAARIGVDYMQGRWFQPPQSFAQFPR